MTTKLYDSHMDISHLWFDELLPRMGVMTWSLFVTLLRFVWQGEVPPGWPGSEELQPCIDRGEIVASVTKGELAQTLGVSPATVRNHLRKLEQMELIQTLPSPHGHTNLYVLGYRHDNHYDWFADRVLNRLGKPELC